MRKFLVEQIKGVNFSNKIQFIMITPKPTNPSTPDDEEDEFDARIRKTGCFEYHEALQQ